MNSKNNKILVTGGAGFIGFHICKLFLDKGYDVYSIDNLNSYYPKKFKIERLKVLNKYSKFQNYNFDISKKNKFSVLRKLSFSTIVHLAAQAGVRDSDKNREKFIDYNIKGFGNILDFASLKKIKTLIYASSSSVYGDTKIFPTKEKDFNNKPLSFYGLTKIINESQAELFYKNNNISLFGLRFFTVYGEYPRPDMAIYKIFDSIYNNKTFNLFNYGTNDRDFTNVENIKNCIYKLVKKNQKKNIHKIFNIGSTGPIQINNLILLIEKITKRQLKVKQLGYNKEDVKKSHSSNSNINTFLNIKKFISIDKGLSKFNDWYLKRYESNKFR